MSGTDFVEQQRASKDFLPFCYSDALSKASRKHRHVFNVTRSSYIPQIDRVMTLEERAGVVKFYDASTCSVEHTLTLSRGAPVAAEYVSGRGGLVMSFGDTTMGMWNLSREKNGGTLKTGSDGTPMLWPSSRVLYSLKWLEKHDKLYSGSVDGFLQSWDIDTREGVSEERGHIDVITDLHHLGGLDTIASTSLDKTICIWDLYTNTIQHTLKGHRLGIMSLAYCPEKHLLLSAGFDHDAHVWSPFSKTIVSRLKGHRSPLVKVCRMGGTASTEMMTADVSGVIKIWDMRNYKCLQSFDSSEQIVSFAYVPSPSSSIVHIDDDDNESRGSRFIGARRNPRTFVASKAFVHVFERDPPPGAGIMNLADDKSASAVVFDANARLILTVHERSVKVWRAENGSLVRELRNVRPSVITAICIGHTGSFVVGEHEGRITSCDLSTGAVRKSFYTHPTEIVWLAYISERRVLLSVDRKGNVLCHDDAHDETGPNAVLLRMDPTRLSGHSDDVTAATYGLMSSLIATGAADGTIRLWNARNGKLDGILRHREQMKVHTTCLQFLAPHHLILACDSSGNLEVFALEDVRGKKKHELYHRSRPFPSDSVLPVSAVACVWDSERSLLISGNDDGSIVCLLLTETIKKGDATKVVWRVPDAHAESVSDITFLEAMRPGCVITASSDRTVCAWNMISGERFAALRQGVRSPHWSFARIDSDEEEEREEEKESATATSSREEDPSLAGVDGPEIEDLRTKFPKIRSMRHSRAVQRREAAERRKKKKEAMPYSGTLPQLTQSARRMAAAEKPYGSLEIKEVFQRTIWDSLKSGHAEDLEGIADEAEKVGLYGVARVARKLFAQNFV